MTVFCSKNLRTPPRLSDILRTGREGHGWDIRSIHLRTHIPTKYVSALETGQFSTLPKARAHRIAYVKEYAIALGLNPEKCLEQFSKEEGLINTAAKTTVDPQKKSLGSLSILFRNILIGGLAAGFMSFLIFQAKNTLEPPTLTVTNPADGLVTSDTSLVFQGTTDSRTTITLNGQELFVDKNNSFTVKLDLINGLNTMEIEAKKKHGKITKKTINVIVKPKIGTAVK
jgi:cytoskeletal protein RodZ